MKHSVVVVFFVSLLISCSNTKSNYFVTGNKNFKIVVPSYLVQSNEINEGAIINLCEDTSDINNGLSLAVYTDSVYEDSTLITLGDYSNYIAENFFDETLSSDVIESPKDTVVNNLDCQKFIISAILDSDSIKVNYNFCIYKLNNSFYNVTIMCKTDKENFYKPEINKIINSFEAKRPTI